MIMEYKRREADRYAREVAYFAEQHRRTMQRIEIQEDQDAALREWKLSV
jgi:Zn-dependent protease with chaperone function